MKTVAIFQPRFAPQLHWWNRMLQSDIFVIYDDVQFRRQRWQSRFEVMSNEGKRVKLTIPINHDDHFKPINEVRVVQDPNQRWQRKMMKTFEMYYKKTPYYTNVLSLIDECIRKEYLFEMQQLFISTVYNLMRIDTDLVFSSDLGVSGKSTRRLVDICTLLGADEYLCGGTALANYMELDLFKEVGVKVTQQQWDCKYPFGNISIIDVLMRYGEMSRKWIE